MEILTKKILTISLAIEFNQIFNKLSPGANHLKNALLWLVKGAYYVLLIEPVSKVMTNVMLCHVRERLLIGQYLNEWSISQLLTRKEKYVFKRTSGRRKRSTWSHFWSRWVFYEDFRNAQTFSWQPILFLDHFKLTFSQYRTPKNCPNTIRASVVYRCSVPV